MKKMITMMMAAVLALTMLAGCGGKTTGSVSTDGSTSMEKVIGALGEAFQNDTGISFTYNPTGSAPASRLCRKAAATSVFLPVI